MEGIFHILIQFRIIPHFWNSKRWKRRVTIQGTHVEFYQELNSLKINI